MKKHIIFLLPFLLSGCYINNGAVESYEFLTARLESVSENKAVLFWNRSNITFLDEIKFDKPIVAGDYLKITFDHSHSKTCDNSWPGNCELKGKVKSYELTEAPIWKFDFRDKDDLPYYYQLASDYNVICNGFVLTDEEGHYVSISEFEGTTVFLSGDASKKNVGCTWPPAEKCGTDRSREYICGIYAFNPRPVEE